MQDEDKKQIYIGPTIQLIQNSQYLIKNDNNLLLLNKRQLILLDLESQSMTTSKIQTDRIICTTLHEQLNIYLIKGENQIYAINQAGQMLGQIILKSEISLMQSRYIFIIPLKNGQCEDLHERIDKIIYITDQHIHIVDVKLIFERGMLKNKRISKFQIQIIKKQVRNHINPQIVLDAPQWIDKCKIFKSLGYFICYNKQQIWVYKLPSFRSQQLSTYLTYYRKSSKTQSQITDVIISERQKQLIIGYSTGIIKIYRFNKTKKFIQQLKGHQKQCSSLYLTQFQHNKKGKNQDILYSAGLDNTIRLWNISHFQQLYNLRVDLICERIILISDELTFINSSNYRKTSLCKINAHKMQPILSQNKGGKIVNLKCDQQWILSIYSNNYVQMFLMNNQQQIQQIKQFQKQIAIQLNDYTNQKSIYSEKIQFPLKFGNVNSAIKIKNHLYAIILDKGFSLIKLDTNQIKYKKNKLKKLTQSQSIENIITDTQSSVSEQQIDDIYNVQNNNKSTKNKLNQKQKKQHELINEKLLGTYIFSIIEDWKGIPTAINVSFISFFTGKNLPFWDMDQKKKKNNEQKRKKSPLLQKYQQKSQEQNAHIILGTDKGVIFFINLQNRMQFQTRVIMHSNQIQLVNQFIPTNTYIHNKKQIFFISYDKGKQFCFWSLSEDHPPYIYCRVISQLKISHLSIHNNFMLVGQKDGKVSILQLALVQNSNDNLISSALPNPSGLKKKTNQFYSSNQKNRQSMQLTFKQINNQTIYGHMKTVTTGDYSFYKQKNLFLTGGQDSKIKLWMGIQKHLLFQLKIFDPVIHLRFTNIGLNFIIAHNDQLSNIKSQNINQIMKIDYELDRKYNNEQYKNIKNVLIGQFFSKTQFPNLTNKLSLKLDHNQLKTQDNNHFILEDGQLLTNKNMNFKNKYNSISGVPNPFSEISQTVNILNNNRDKNQLQQIKQQSNMNKINNQLNNFETSEKIKSNSIDKNKIYARSEQKIKAKKSFRILNTSSPKQINQSMFMLPKIPQNIKKKNKIVHPNTNFTIGSFINQIKSSRNKAFSFVGRYQK